jgi:hypothetical protein
VSWISAAIELLKTTYPVPLASFLFVAIAFAVLFHELRKKR